MAIPYLIKSGYIDEKTVEERYDWVKTIVLTIQEAYLIFQKYQEKLKFSLTIKSEPEDESALEMLKGEQVPSLLNAFKEELAKIEEVDEEFSKGIMKKIQKATGVKGKNLFMPTRIALTGNNHGPELTNIIYILGKQTS